MALVVKPRRNHVTLEIQKIECCVLQLIALTTTKERGDEMKTMKKQVE